MTNDLNGAASQDTELGMSHVQSGAVSGVLKEPQQQSDNGRELKCVGKRKGVRIDSRRYRCNQ